LPTNTTSVRVFLANPAPRTPPPAAALAGWMVLRVTTDMIQDGRALAFLESALAGSGRP